VSDESASASEGVETNLSAPRMSLIVMPLSYLLVRTWAGQEHYLPRTLPLANIPVKPMIFDHFLPSYIRRKREIIRHCSMR
jgi:hypothetical protein